MNKKSALSLLIGAAVSIVALYFAFRHVPISDLLSYMVSMNYFWVLLSVVVGLVSFLIRVYRWQILLGPDVNISYWDAYHPLIIGFTVNCILPGRVGEFARPVILRQKSNVPFTVGIATVAAERVFDVIILIGLFAWVLATVEIDPNLNIAFGETNLNRDTLLMITSGMLKLSIVMIAGILMLGFDTTRQLIKKCIMGLPRLFFFTGNTVKTSMAHRICQPLAEMVENIAVGFAQLKNVRSLVFCIALSIVVWIFAGASYYIMSLGCPGIGLSMSEMVAVMVIICFFIALPSVPGYWGIWEAGGVFALYLFGVQAKDAAGFTLANHAIQMIPVMLLGFLSAFITGVSLTGVSLTGASQTGASQTKAHKHRSDTRNMRNCDYHNE